MAEDEQIRAVPVEGGRQPLQPFAAEFAGNAGVDDATADQGLQSLRVTRTVAGSGAAGEAVAEGEDDGVGGQGGEPGPLLAATAEQRDQKHRAGLK